MEVGRERAPHWLTFSNMYHSYKDGNVMLLPPDDSICSTVLEGLEAARRRVNSFHHSGEKLTGASSVRQFIQRTLKAIKKVVFVRRRVDIYVCGRHSHLNHLH